MERQAVSGLSKDNMKVEQLRLIIWPDGSAIVEADWRHYMDDELPIGVPDTKRMIRAVFAEPCEYAEFGSTKEIAEVLG